jgi:hypothetical protein
MAMKLSDIFSSNDININNPKLEEVFSKTKDVAESMSKRSAEHIEISRKRVEILDAKTKLSKQYEKFGEMQYNIHIGEQVDASELEETANRISALKEKIDVLSIEVEDAKAKFNEAISSATKKTRDAFQKEFDKVSKNEVTVEGDESDDVEVTEAKE